MTDLLEPETKTKTRHAIPPRTNHVTLFSIGTATPPAVTQEEATTLAESFTCTTSGQSAWLHRVFSRAGVNHRGTVLKTGPGIDEIHAFYGPPTSPEDRGPTTATRMIRYAQEAPVLAQRAAQSALDQANIAPHQITHLITVSCTGFSAPGLDVELIERLGLAPNVHRLHLGFMGCHAAFNALGAAKDAALADPNALVLVCCVELSTLHFAYGFHPEKLVANALFADGAAACIVGVPSVGVPPSGGLRDATNSRTQMPAAPAFHHTQNSEPRTQNFALRDTASLLLPNSKSAMTWHVGDHGFEMTLSSELPALIASHIRPWIESFLAKHDLTLPDIRHWAIHPGGPKILTAAATALSLPPSATAPSHQLLADHGNMSSATILFLLKKIASENPAPGGCVAIGFGPGLMAEGMLLEI